MEAGLPDVAVVNAPIGRRIARAYRGLSQGQRRAADFLLGKPFDAATMTIEEFASAAAVSPATANRFARALGFARYIDFRTEIVEAIRPARAQEEKLAAARHGASAAGMAKGSLAEDLANLRNTADALSAVQAEAAAA